MFLFLANEQIQVVPLILSLLAILSLIILLCIFCDNGNNKLDTKCIAFAGISVALSIGLSFIKLFALPQGGSVTLFSLLPVLLFSYIYGTRKGVFVGLILGFINLAIDPFIVHPAQLFLDYPIAFSCMGLVGVFSKIKAINRLYQLDFALGSILAGVVRFISHVLSGVFAFSSYADKSVWIYSLAYNSFVFVDIGIAIAVGVICLSIKPLFKLILDRKQSVCKIKKSNNKQ